MKKSARYPTSVTSPATATAPASMNMTTIWYRTAVSGEVPERISPVIMPGRATIPTIMRRLSIGITAALSALHAGRRAARSGEAPRARYAST